MRLYDQKIKTNALVKSEELPCVTLHVTEM